MTAGVAGLVVTLFAVPVPASAQQSSIRAWAEWAVGRGQWKGPIVAHPELVDRPRSRSLALRSRMRPLSVHAPAAVPLDTAREALSALEYAYDILLRDGWPEPIADGDRGGGAGFDLYLEPSADEPAAAHADAPLGWSLLDGVAGFAVVNPDLVEPWQLEACVAAALTQAILLQQDPAESGSWRRATGAYTAWLLTGFFGCGDEVTRQQQQSWRGWITAGAGSGEGGALMLAMLSEREDGGSGAFVRELWQFARQSSHNASGGVLRASPDMWEVLDRALENAGESLDEVVQEMAVARYFSGPEPRRRGAGYRVLRALPSNAAVPLAEAVPLSRLPAHLPVSDHPVEAYGSSYALIDTSGTAGPFRLKVWLRAEQGVRWSLVAVRLTGDGREAGRTSAPARPTPDSYLAVELDGKTERVLLVVTNLSNGLADADRDTGDGHAFQLIVDADGYAPAR